MAIEEASLFDSVHAVARRDYAESKVNPLTAAERTAFDAVFEFFESRMRGGEFTYIHDILALIENDPDLFADDVAQLRCLTEETRKPFTDAVKESAVFVVSAFAKSPLWPAP